MTAAEVIEMFQSAKFVARHGDVVVVSDHAEPAPEAGKLDCQGVVAEGEVTGHAHRVKHGEVLRVVDDLIHRTIVAHENATLDHEEHQQMPLPAGKHKTAILRTVTPTGELGFVGD